MSARLGAEIFSSISRMFNVAKNDTADLTLSARASRDDLKIRKYIDWFFRTFFGHDQHCKFYWLREINNCKRRLREHDKLIEEGRLTEDDLKVSLKSARDASW